MNTQEAGVKISVYGIVKHKRYRPYLVDFEGGVWNYRPFYLYEDRLILSLVVNDILWAVGDCILIEGKEHKITKRQFTLNGEVSYTVNTILDTIVDEETENSKKTAGEQAQQVIDNMKRGRMEYEEKNPAKPT